MEDEKKSVNVHDLEYGHILYETQPQSSCAAINLSNYLQSRHLNQSCYEKHSACIIDVLEDGKRMKHFDTNYCCKAHFTTSTFSCPQQFRSLRLIIPLGQTRYGDALKVWDSNVRLGKVVECQPCRSKFDDTFIGPNRSNYSIPYGWQHDSIRGQRVDRPLQFVSINGPSRHTMPMIPAISIQAGQGNTRTNTSRTGSFSIHDICQLHEGEEMLLKVAHLSLCEESESWGTSSEITYQQMTLDREHLNFDIFESEITIRRYSDNYLEYHFNADESGILQSTMIRQLLRSSSMLRYFNGHLQPGIRLALFDALNGFLSRWLEFLTQLNKKGDLKISTTNSTDTIALNQEVSILEQDFITNISRTLRDFIQAVDAVKREILSWPNVDVKTRAKLERSFVEIDTRITTSKQWYKVQ